MAKERRRRRSVITGVAVTAGGVLGVAQPAFADTFQVNDAGDSGDGVCQDAAAGDCTLRDAVIESNDNTGVFDDITFASSITGVTLGGTELSVTEGVYIQGNGANATTISGDDTSRLFNLDPPKYQPVAFRDLTLTAGAAAGGYGGAIYNHGANMEISGSVLTLNSANKGGAIFDPGVTGENTEITDSTISENTAADDGAGFFAGGSAGRIFNSTISGNHAGATGDDYGGGLFITSDSFLYDSTVTGNSAGYGGGIYAHIGPDAAHVYIYNSIVGGNTATAPGGNFPPGPDVYGATTAGFSLIETTDDSVVLTEAPGGSNMVGQDPQLGLLQDNGGPTPTQKPALTSPIIDKGLSDSSVDQRGSARPFDVPSIANASGGDAADMGAVELQASDFPAPPGGGSPPLPPGASVTGQRAAALKKCKQRAKKKHWTKKRLKGCKQKARGLPF
jgi:hypothetical protein